MSVASLDRPSMESSPHNWDVNPVLTVEHLTMRFGGLVAVNDLSFNVGRGDITALIGPNGAGKTTVFNCVTGFYKATEGRTVMRHGPGLQAELIDEVTAGPLKWKETDNGAVFLLERMPDFEISQKAKVARTFQNIRLFGGMTSLENLLVAQHNPLMVASGYTVGGIFGLPGFRVAEREAIEKARYWLEHVGLIERADDPAADLPYGDQRRLEIARAMCTDPLLLCLDEPAAGLNPRESGELNQILKFIRDKHGTSILLIEHDMGVVMEISDHIVVLDYGVKISDGSADFVRTDPKVIAAYLGVDDEELETEPEVIGLVTEAIGEDAAVAADIPVDQAALPETEAASPASSTVARGVSKRTASPKGKSSKPETIGGASAKGPRPNEVEVADAGNYPGAQPPGLKAPENGAADKLTRISGIGPVNERKLNALGIWHFRQIAEWKKREVEWVGAYLAFPGRIEREEWVKQAKALAREGRGSKGARK